MAVNLKALSPGDKLHDNDPRMRNRDLTITEVLPNGVAACGFDGRIRLYLAHRIFDDGKARRYGYSVVRPA